MNASQQSPPRHRATLVEVARLAGVSHQTVSRYLQQNGGMKPDTVTRVQQAIEALDYHPNLVARSMRTRRTGRLAIVVPASSTFAPLRLLAAAANVAHDAGYVVETVSFEGDALVRAARVRELADSGQTDGILALAPLAGWSDRVRESLSVSVLVAPAYDDDMHGIGELADGASVREVLTYLVSIGHRRFYHVAGRQTWPSARNRKQVYLDSVSELGVESYGVFDGDWSGQSGYDAVAALPPRGGPTALIAANDIVAMGAIRAAHDRGWGVPENLSVFGWDDNEGSEFLVPSLSTVSVDREAQGREAMLRLIGEIKNDPVEAGTNMAINHLVIRESTGAPWSDS
jgi:LacI family repressor for deo operon, udp, cdd, tsx, nupC, and nupG